MNRPTPEHVKDLVASLAAQDGPQVSTRLVIDALRLATGCSRATAYRALADAISQGTVGRVLDTAD